MSGADIAGYIVAGLNAVALSLTELVALYRTHKTRKEERERDELD